MNTVTDALLDELSEKAKQSPRKRAHHLFHHFDDPVQRMINAMEPGAYIQPHKHENPDKIEAFVILRGKAACLQFDNQGKVVETHILDTQGPEYAIDVPPRSWHTFISLKSGTALFEVVQGPYDPSSHKNLAPWAPPEAEGAEYLKALEQEVLRRVSR